MFELLGITPQWLVAQLLAGLIDGSFYAILSLELAIIFGILNVINVTHCAQYTMSAFIAWIGLTQILVCLDCGFSCIGGIWFDS